jgi:hypothetical protein
VAKYIFRRQSQRHGIDWLDAEKRLDTWFVYLNSLPWVSGQLDRSSYLGFLRAVSLSIPQETAFAEILRRVKNADLHARLNKLEHQQRLAFQYAGEKKWTPGEYNYPPPASEPEFDPEALRQTSHKLPEASPRYLYQRSPINPAEVDTERFLQTIFRPGEHAVIFEQFRSQGQLVWNRDRSGIDADQASRLESFKTQRGMGPICAPANSATSPTRRLPRIIDCGAFKPIAGLPARGNERLAETLLPQP